MSLLSLFPFLELCVSFFFQVRAALLECQQVILWGSVLLLSSAATLPHLTQRYLRPDCHRSLHGAVLPRRHVPHVHERHLGGLSKTGENFDWQVSNGLREGILCTSNVECHQKRLTRFLHAFLLFSLLDSNVTAQPWMWSSTRYSTKTCQQSSDRSRLRYSIG